MKLTEIFHQKEIDNATLALAERIFDRWLDEHYGGLDAERERFPNYHTDQKQRGNAIRRIMDQMMDYKDYPERPSQAFIMALNNIIDSALG